MRRFHKDKSQKFQWFQVARDFYKKSNDPMIFRNQKACREHWISNLDPSLNK